MVQLMVWVTVVMLVSMVQLMVEDWAGSDPAQLLLILALLILLLPSCPLLPLWRVRLLPPSCSIPVVVLLLLLVALPLLP